MKSKLPKVERLHDGKPLIQPIAGHPWENKVTFNPACALVQDKHELHTIVKQLPFVESIKSKLRD